MSTLSGHGSSAVWNKSFVDCQIKTKEPLPAEGLANSAVIIYLSQIYIPPLPT